MTRRTLFRSLAALPLVGRVVAKRITDGKPNVSDDPWVLCQQAIDEAVKTHGEMVRPHLRWCIGAGFHAEMYMRDFMGSGFCRNEGSQLFDIKVLGVPALVEPPRYIRPDTAMLYAYAPWQSRVTAVNYEDKSVTNRVKPYGLQRNSAEQPNDAPLRSLNA